MTFIDYYPMDGKGFSVITQSESIAGNAKHNVDASNSPPVLKVLLFTMFFNQSCTTLFFNLL